MDIFRKTNNFKELLDIVLSLDIEKKIVEEIWDKLLLDFPHSVDCFFVSLIEELYVRSLNSKVELKIHNANQLSLQKVVAPFCNDLYKKKGGLKERFIDIILQLNLLRRNYV